MVCWQPACILCGRFQANRAAAKDNSFDDVNPARPSIHYTTIMPKVLVCKVIEGFYHQQILLTLLEWKVVVGCGRTGL